MKKCFRSAKWIYALCLSKKSKILSLAYLKADDSTLFLNRDIHMYDKCMTKQNENRVAGIYNAVSVRSEADSNRCTRFCRPLPSHSAIRPLFPNRFLFGFHSVTTSPLLPDCMPRRKHPVYFQAHRECKYTNISNFCKTSAQLCVISRRNSRYFPKFVTFTHRKKTSFHSRP